jgi:hypothetical protein
MAAGPNFLATKNRANFLSTRNSGVSGLRWIVPHMGQSAASRPGRSSHIWDNPDSRPVRRRGGMLSDYNSSALRQGGLSHIWDSPRLPGRGDRPIYGTIRIPGLSGVEGGCFLSITPRALQRGVCPRFHDIPARYRVGLSGRSMAWRRSGGGLREGRRVIPGMEGPNFVATKNAPYFMAPQNSG